MRGEEPVSNVVDDSDISCDAELCAAHTGCKYYNPNKESNVNHCIGGLPLQLAQMKERSLYVNSDSKTHIIPRQDIDNAASQYVENLYKGREFDIEEAPLDEISKIDFIAGAKWQKEQLIDKACSFLHHYQEYPNHDIATDKLVEAFKMYIEL